MKKIITVLVVIVMVACAFSGCAGKDGTKDQGGVKWETASGDSVFNGGVQGGSKDEGNSVIKDETPASSQGSQVGGSDSSDETPASSNPSSNSSSNSSNNSSSNKPSNNSSNASSNVSSTPAEEPEEDEIKDISGNGITQNGVETILSTKAITSEFSRPTFKKYTYEYSSSQKMCYSVCLPEGYNESQKYPVLFFLHGIKQSGKDWNTLEHLTSLYQYNADIVNRAIVVSPQSTHTDLWYMAKGGNGDMAYSLLTNVIEKNYSVDMNRIYIIGLSMGGMGTWGMIEEYPDHFAAASPICGSGNPQKAKSLINIPIWAWHGTLDTTVDYNGYGASPKMYEAIKQAGGNKIIFTKLQNEGHNAWDPAFRSREHLSWLFSQVKGKHQSTEYSMIPYLTVQDSNGKVIVSEKDAIDIETRAGTGKASGMRDLVLTLSKDGAEKLSDAYQKSGGKEFKIYFGNKEIVTFKATQKTNGRVMVIRDVFYEGSYSNYYSKLLTTVGKD